MITIIAFLGILSAVLIYSLMISDVEDRTFEFGMLRALGFNTDNVVFTITAQALMFSVPGLLIGLSIAACMNVGVRYILFSLTRNVADYLLSSGAIWVGCFIGLVIPILSNIIPIRAALGKNLRSSLDLYHRAIGEMQVSVQKLGEYGLSVEQFTMAFMLVILGIITYYGAPVAFLFQNYRLFFIILNSLLIVMILGMTFLAALV